MIRSAKVVETFLICEESDSSPWGLKFVGDAEDKVEAFERAKAAARFDSREVFVIPCYRGQIDFTSTEAIPEVFANVQPKGELPNPVTEPSK